MQKPEKKNENDLLSKVWDFIFEPHRDKPAPKPEAPKKAKQIKKDQPKKEEVKQNDRPEIKPASDNRGKYKITERTYYTDEPPKAEQRPVKPDDTPAPAPAPEATGTTPTAPENEPDANQTDRQESKSDDVAPV